MTRDLTAWQMRLGLLAAYALHLLILGLYVFDVIPQQFHAAGRPLWLHHGGDNVGYFNLARDLLSGPLQPSKYPLGFPLLLTPFLVIFQPHDQQDLLEIVAAFWGVVMFPLGQWALARLAARLTGRRWLAVLAVLLWTALPLLLYGLLRLVSSPVVAEIGSVHLLWAQMLSDGPATLFTLLLMGLFFWGRGRADRSTGWAVGLGALGGFLMLIRLTGALTVGLIGLALLVERRWRAAAVMALAALIVFSPQLLYNAHFFGSPLRSGYQVLDDLPAEGLFSPSYLTGALAAAWARLGLGAPLLALAAAALAGIGLVWLGRQDRVGAWMVGLWLASYVALYSLYYYSWVGGLTRFLMPAYPAAAILAAGVVGRAAAWVGERRAGQQKTLP